MGLTYGTEDDFNFQVPVLGSQCVSVTEWDKGTGKEVMTYVARIP